MEKIIMKFKQLSNNIGNDEVINSHYFSEIPNMFDSKDRGYQNNKSQKKSVVS